MKKSLIALAVLGAISGAVAAQSSVTVYGQVDVGLNAERGGPNGSLTKLTSGNEFGSRLGFKGVEDLGDGLKANFLMESGIAADTGGFNQGNLAFARQSYVGLSGNFGEVRMGRQYSPFDALLGGTDPFVNGLVGKAGNLMSRTSVGGVLGSHVDRFNNGVQYFTPSFSGVTADVGYGFGEQAGNADKNRFLSTSVGYTNGPLLVRVLTQKMNNATATGSARNSMLAGTYDFSVAKLHLQYATNKTDTTGITTVDSKNLLVGVTVPFGASKVIASYIRKDDRLAANQDANQLAVGYIYALSKRTDLYAAYARMNNSNGVFYTVGNSSEAGSGDKGYNLGLRHTF